MIVCSGIDSQQKEAVKKKVVFSGSTVAGKSYLLSTIMKHQYKAVVTGSIDFYNKTVNRFGKQYILQLWDTAGVQALFQSSSKYIKGTDVLVLVYDITDQRSLGYLQRLDREYEKNKTKEAVKIVVGKLLVISQGNKMDLQNRFIDAQGGKNWAQKHGAYYIEVSAVTGQNVELLIDTIVELIDSKQ